MGRKRKNPNPNEISDSGALSGELPEVIPVEVQGHEEAEPKSFSQRAAEKLSSLVVEEDGNLSIPETTPKRTRKKWVPKAQREETQTELSTLVSSIFILIFAVSKWPEEVKPDEEEIGGVSHHMTRILLRHIDISGKLTGDVLDVIGMIAIGSSWYARVAPTLRQYNNQWRQGATVSPQRSMVSGQIAEEAPQSEEWVTPIEQASPTMKEWLDHAASEEEQTE